jgi:hypothetical protein
MIAFKNLFSIPIMEKLCYKMRQQWYDENLMLGKSSAPYYL